ncbi:MAG: hypothetical protein E7479_03415 [Ruminococcaceae bacterium]|nr:hypothetical protein [Oscillospiraceae bacterium]
MKKIIAFVLVLVLLFSGCGFNEEVEKFIDSVKIPEEKTENPVPEISGQVFETREEETKTNEEKQAFYEEILINFGGIINYEGKLAVRKGISFYYNDEGYADFSSEDPESFYSWIESRTSVEDRTEVSIPGFNGNVYAYSADFFENEVFKYFGRTAESLRVSDFYYPEQNCYFIDGHGGIGDVPYILINSIAENSDFINFNITLDYSSEEDRNMILTVKLLPDGGYNYVSYLKE